MVTMPTVAADPPGAGAPPPALPPELTADDERILAYASAIGREFDFDLLARATGMDEEGLAERLEHLVHVRVIRERIGGDRFVFADDEFRVRIYQSLTSSRLRVLHRKVAEALEKLHSAPDAAVVAELGRHYFLGKVPEKSYEFNRRGAERGRSEGDPEAVAHHLERVRIDLAALPGDHARELTDLAQELGDLYFEMGDDRRADRLYSEGLERSEPSDQQRRARFILSRAEIAREHMEIDLARRLAGEAAALFGALDDPAGVASVHRILGRIHFEKGEYREALEEAHQALELLRSRPDERTLGRLCTDIGNAFSLLGPEMADEATAWYEKAIHHLEAKHDWLELGRAYHNLGSQVGAVSPQLGLEYLQKARELAERTRDMRWTAWALFTGVEMRLSVGQLEEAERDNQQATRLLERVADPIGFQQVALNRGLIAERRGEWEDAEAAYKESLERSEKLKMTPEVAESHFLLARLHYKLRDFDSARVEYETARRGDLPTLKPGRATAFVELGRQLAHDAPPVESSTPPAPSTSSPQGA